jgi:hypothetical protein
VMSDVVEVDQVNRARRLLAIGAWTMLGWVVIGFIITIPSVDRALLQIEEMPWSAPVITLAFLSLGITGVVLWYAAVRLAILTKQGSSAKRFAMIVILLVGNFVSAFFYYFAYVLWHSSSEFRTP